MKTSRLFCRLDLSFFENPKIKALDPIAREVLLKLITYCGRELTDGFVTRNAALELANMEPFRELLGEYLGRRPLAKLNRNLLSSGAILDRLWRAGVLEVVPGGYHIHDYLDWQQSSEEVHKRREKDTLRQRKWRAKSAKCHGVTTGVTPDAQITEQQYGSENHKQQATIQRLVDERGADELVVADLVSTPLSAEQPPATETTHAVTEVAPVSHEAQEAPKPTREPKQATRANTEARAWQPGADVRSEADYRAWVASLGWTQGCDNAKNRERLNELLARGPIGTAELAAIVPVVEREATGKGNGGFTLVKLLQAREDRGQPRRVAVNAPDAEQVARNEAHVRALIEKASSGIEAIPPAGMACFREVAAM